MCGSQQPLEGADSGQHPLVVTDEEYERFLTRLDYLFHPTEPKQVQCGTYIEREGVEGFCVMNPDHEGRCQLS